MFPSPLLLMVYILLAFVLFAFEFLRRRLGRREPPESPSSDVDQVGPRRILYTLNNEISKAARPRLLVPYQSH